MKDNLNEPLESQSKKLTDRELLERSFISLHRIEKKVNFIDRWHFAMIFLIIGILLYEFPPLWLR